MENINLKEDLITAGEPVPAEEVRQVKDFIIKKALGSDNLDTSKCSDEERDNLLGKAGILLGDNINEKCEKIIGYALSERLEATDVLQKALGFKESEAVNVYFDYLRESSLREAENAQDLKAKEKEEILAFNEPEADVSMGKNIFKVDSVDHCEDLEDQRGEKLGKYKIEGMN